MGNYTELHREPELGDRNEYIYEGNRTIEPLWNITRQEDRNGTQQVVVALGNGVESGVGIQ